MQYQVKTDQFSGPLDKLLSLIQEKKIDINRLGLASVTQDFISYVESLENVQPILLADFVQTASRLLLIKSKSLLPTLELSTEEEADIADLEARLMLYQHFSVKQGKGDNAAAHVDKLWQRKEKSYSRQMLQQLFAENLFYPPKDLKPEHLQTSLRTLFASLKDLLPQKAEIKIKLTSLQDKMAELKQTLERVATQDFSRLSEGKDRQEVVVLFLAILHLFANKLLEVKQDQGFGSITISKKNEHEPSQ